MSSSTRRRFWIIGLVALVPVAILAVIAAMNFAGGIYRATLSPYLDSEIAKDLTLTRDWLEISPGKPQHAERQIQYLVLTFAGTGEPDIPKSGIRLPNGSLVVPEVHLIDESGRAYYLHAVAFGPAVLSFASHDLPKDKTFRTVRQRSNEPIRVISVRWRRWNQWDSVE